MNEKIEELIKKLKEKKEEAGRVRDEIREILTEFTEIADSLDNGVEGIADAIREFERAVDSMSEYV